MMEAIQKFTALKHKKRHLPGTSDDEHNERVKKAFLKDDANKVKPIEYQC